VICLNRNRWWVFKLILNCLQFQGLRLLAHDDYRCNVNCRKLLAIFVCEDEDDAVNIVVKISKLYYFSSTTKLTMSVTSMCLTITIMMIVMLMLISTLCCVTNCRKLLTTALCLTKANTKTNHQRLLCWSFYCLAFILIFSAWALAVAVTSSFFL